MIEHHGRAFPNIEATLVFPEHVAPLKQFRIIYLHYIWHVYKMTWHYDFSNLLTLLQLSTFSSVYMSSAFETLQQNYLAPDRY